MNTIELKKEALSHGLCEKWAVRWTDEWGTGELLRALNSLDGIEFLAKKHFPSLAFILENSDNRHEDYGLVIKKIGEYTLKPTNVKYHFCGCKVKINVPDYWVGFVYLSHGTNADVVLGKNSDVYLRRHLDSNVEVLDKDDGASIKIEQIKE